MVRDQEKHHAAPINVPLNNSYENSEVPRIYGDTQGVQRGRSFLPDPVLNDEKHAFLPGISRVFKIFRRC